MDVTKKSCHTNSFKCKSIVETTNIVLPLIVENDALFSVVHLRFDLPNNPSSESSKIREDILPSNGVIGPVSPPLFGICSGRPHVLIKVQCDVACVLFGGVHHVGLVQDVNLPVRDDLLQVVRQHLASNVDTDDGVPAQQSKSIFG